MMQDYRRRALAQHVKISARILHTRGPANSWWTRGSDLVPGTGFWHTLFAPCLHPIARTRTSPDSSVLRVLYHIAVDAACRLHDCQLSTDKADAAVRAKSYRKLDSEVDHRAFSRVLSTASTAHHRAALQLAA